jgi:hypothetical protein
VFDPTFGRRVSSAVLHLHRARFARNSGLEQLTMHDDAAEVPLGHLAHALRTPLNLLEGHATLLLAGASGRLDGEARSAVLAMHGAARTLTRTIGLLDALALAVPDDAGPVAWRPLLASWDRAAAVHGWTPADGSGTGRWPEQPWFDGLAALAVAAVDERGCHELTLRIGGEDGTLELVSRPFDGGGEDGGLAASLLRSHLQRAGLDLHRSGGELSLRLGHWLHGDLRRRWTR